ncbi:MAG: polyprenol monophosphomannose synthase [Crocinitomicaceae bacterium]|nr:polyprenol monophosphomannose synthase [Crocinitomicaceae bacterium]
MTNNNSLIIIPTFNEKENVDKMIDAVLELHHSFHVLFVDDNSPDGTADIISKRIAGSEGRVHLEKRKGKLGLGTAYIHGFRWAIKHQYNFVFEMDCDFSHNPKDLIRLQQELKNGTDLVIGSRYCRGGKVKNWPFKRILMSYFASVYVRLILFISIKDTTAGFKGYRLEVLEKIKLDDIHFKGYAFQICMKYAALRHKFKVKEIPITFVDRVQGVSKMSTGIFKEAFFGVWKMRRMKL